MISLEVSQYAKMEPMPCYVPLFVHGVLNQTIPGTVYTDEDSQQAFLIGTQSGLFFVMGNPARRAFNQALLSLYRDRIRRGDRFTLFSPSVRWDQAIAAVFNKEVIKVSRYSFTFNQDTYLQMSRIFPEKFVKQKINEPLIRQSVNFNENYYDQYWGSAANFLEQGFGYCLLHNGRIVSECTSIFKANQWAEIDIATASEWRGKGLALPAAQAFIDRCIDHQIIPRWECNIHHSASIKLGNKLGFEDPREYSIFVKAR